MASPDRPKDRLAWLPRPLSRIGSRTARIGTARHFRFLEWVVVAILVINALDALFTIAWIYSGQAEEANPMMADLVHRHPVWFVVAKTTLVTGGSFILWVNRKRPLAVVAIFLLFLAYYFVLLIHVEEIGFVLWGER